MISQPSLFDSVRPSFSRTLILQGKQDMTPAEARDQAIQAVENHGNKAWQDRCIAVIRGLCQSKAQFTMDDVWDALRGCNEHTDEGRELGAVIIRAARLGLCKNTGNYQKSRLPVRHARPISIWRSLLFPSTQ